MNILNLTEHPILVLDYRTNEVILDLKASDVAARVIEQKYKKAELNGVPIMGYKNTKVINMPEPAKDTYYVVSKIVYDTLKNERNDLLTPDSGNAIRDNRGKVFGVTALLGSMEDNTVK